MKKIFYFLLFIFLILQTAITKAETAETIYAKAYGDIYKNNTKSAINLFKKGIAIYPDCAFLYAGMGDAYLKEGDYQKAMDSYTTAQKMKQAIDNYKLDFYYASLKKNYSDISKALNEIISATKYSDNEILYKNINFIMNENYDKTLFIPDLYTVEDIGENETFPNKDAELKEYLKILSGNQNNFQAANNAGVMLIYLKDYQLAEKYLKQALENNPNSPIILNNLAIANIHLYRFNEAEQFFNHALKEKSDYIPAINNLAVAKIHIGLSKYQTKNVNTILDIAKKDNTNLYAWRVLSSMYFLKGDYKNAYNLLNQFDSDYNFNLYSQKAYVAFKNRNYSNALSAIDKAIYLYSKNTSDYVLKGRILDATGDYVTAKSTFRQAINMNSKNQNTNYYLARTLYKSGDKYNANSIMCEFLTSKNGNSQTDKINLLFE